jgi:hypothetical protein
MTRGWVVLAAALALAWAAEAGAEPRGQKAQKSPAAHELPLHVYLAKGEANACGEGCSEWIAVEGRFDSGAAGRVVAFLQRHGTPKLPVYFHSPGGDARAAVAIGRFLRARGLTAGVGKTVPRACASASDQAAACRAAKRSAQAVAADWRPDAFCNSACVYALIGGKVRQVPPAARLGIHSVKLTMFRKHADGRVQALTANEAPSLHKTRAADFNAQLRRYVMEMGINVMLFDATMKVPHEDIYYLSRDDIAAYGIDRREYAESPWFTIQYSNNTFHLNKWMVEARGAERKEYRVSIVLLSCAQAQRATIRYLRGLASAEVGRPVTAAFSIGKHKAILSLRAVAAKQDTVDTGGLFSSSANYVPFDELEAAAAHGAIGIVETGAFADTKQQRVIELSTQGLAEGIKQLREKCIPVAQAAPGAAPVQPSPWAPPAQVPFVPAQAGSESTPASPYGAYPVPERGLGGRVSREKK